MGDLTSDSLIDSALARAIFDIREEELISLYNLDSEHRLVEAIRNGNLALVTDRVGEVKYSVDRLRAPFAQETKRQREYEVVALITIATRAAVSGGLDVDTAFSMSDLYLQRIDKHKTFRELEEIARHAIRSFCEKVAECKVKNWGNILRAYKKPQNISAPTCIIRYLLRSGELYGNQSGISFLQFF